MEALASFLITEIHILENGTEQARKEVKEQIPSDRIKDAQSLARELRWRVRLSLYGSSDDEREVKMKINGNGNRIKRKRSVERVPLLVEDIKAEVVPPLTQLKPKVWQGYLHKSPQLESRHLKLSKPTYDDEHWTEKWTRLGDQEQDEEKQGDEVRVERKTEFIVKVRRTDKGIERQRVERVLERWEWTTSSQTEEGSSKS